MKIALVCSHGGHLTEMLYLMDAFVEHDIFFVTYHSPRTEWLLQIAPTYCIANIGKNPLRLLSSFFHAYRILASEKPQVIVSLGAEIAIPFFYMGKFLGMRTVFIEGWHRVISRSATGRIVYPVSDLFLVQWESLLRVYGPKAQYRGALA